MSMFFFEKKEKENENKAPQPRRANAARVEGDTFTVFIRQMRQMVGLTNEEPSTASKQSLRAGNIFIVEMQNGYSKHLLKRLQFYSSSAYVAQLKQGRGYGELAPVFVIVLLGNQVLSANIPLISYHKLMKQPTCSTSSEACIKRCQKMLPTVIEKEKKEILNYYRE